MIKENIPIIEVKNLKKQYKLGQINSATLTNELQSLWARIRKKEDPNMPLFANGARINKGSFMALNGINFSVNRGEAVAIIGGNGAGKSTLLKILSRITTPSEGSAVLRGRVASMLEVGTGFNLEMTGRENVYMNGAILGMTKTEIDEKLDDIIEFSECGDFIDTPVKRYSSGMYVKLAFAVSAHLDSDIMIMDEVLAVGDVKFQKKCLGKMSDSATEDGKTVLYVSHNMATVRQLCTRAIVLKEGEIVFDGDVEGGISVYTEVNIDENFSTSQIYEIDENIKNNKKAAFESLALLNTNNGIVKENDEISLEVKIAAFYNLQNSVLRCVIKNVAGTPIEMKNYIIENVKKDAKYHEKFKFDINNLVEGKYCVDMYFGDFSSFAINNYDAKAACLWFEIVKNSAQQNINWLPEHWGHSVCELEKINETC